jgi:hypothetical protein
MPVVSRFFFAITCFILIVLDGVFAADVDRSRRMLPPRTSSPKLPRTQKADETQPGKSNTSARADKSDTTKDVDADSTLGSDGNLKHRSPPKPASVPPSATVVASVDEAEFAVRERGALLLLSMFQREGRFVDFLQQDVTTFDDSQVGAAARVVHEGCRRALKSHLTVEPIQSEAEGDPITLVAGYDVQAVKLVGNVAGKPPYQGHVQHRGWRATSITLPQEVGAHDASVLAQAEIEL